jgi:hypothetical protein
MQDLKRQIYKDYVLYCYRDGIEPARLVSAFLKAETGTMRGRGSMRVLRYDGRMLVCRKYLHGGLLRRVTRDIFFSARRALTELEILQFLQEQRIPAVQPFCVLARKGGIATKLYLLTDLAENTTELLQFLADSPKKTRLRTIRKLALLFRQLEVHGVFHPDLHLKNILVTPGQEMLLLDFDRAERRKVGRKDMERMFFRLNRYVEKLERQGRITATPAEKTFFLRAYRKISGCDIMPQLKRRLAGKRVLSRIGWFLEALFYRGQS